MKTKTLLMALFAVFTFAFSTSAKEKQESYNMQRAMECAYASDFESALEYLKRELADNPKNADAYLLLGTIHTFSYENGKALSAYTKAIDLYPKKNKKGRATTYYGRGKLYLELCDTMPAISDLEMAVKLQPTDSHYLSVLAKVYALKDRFNDAETLYKKMMTLDIGDPIPYYELAIIAYNQKRYDEALSYIDRGRTLDESTARPDIMEMRVYYYQENYRKALEKAIDTLMADIENEEAYDALCSISAYIYPETISLLKKAVFEDRENRNMWKLYLGKIYYLHGKYEDAIAIYKDVVGDFELNYYALRLMYDCYNDLGYLDKAEELANTLMEMYPDDADMLINRAATRFYAHKLDEAEQDFINGMELDPEYGSVASYYLGWIEEMRGNYGKALENYDMAIILDEDYTYPYMRKGIVLHYKLNRQEEAREALRRCIEKDSISETTCMQYAYAALGERDKAVEVMDSVIALNPDNYNLYYDAACLYSQLEEKENSLKNLRTALEKGFRLFKHMRADGELDFIRDTPEFIELLEEFEKPEKEENSKTESRMVETVTYEIPIQKDYTNVYQLKATVNGLPLDFELDTGASDVSISQVEYDFMLKNGYLKKSDLRGYLEYSDANGDYTTAPVLNISKICIGDVELNNIQACVIPNQKAPLLMGQSVLTKLGKVEIDHDKKMLRITTTK